MPNMKYRSHKEFILGHVVEVRDCWIWQAVPHKSGYATIGGQWSMGENYAHRLSYRVFKDEISENKFVCHTCDNPMCVKPDHLWLGSPSDNSIDAAKKDRLKIKLDIKQVEEIRDLLKCGIHSQYEIANLYDINQSNVSRIKSKQRRQYV